LLTIQKDLLNCGR